MMTNLNNVGDVAVTFRRPLSICPGHRSNTGELFIRSKNPQSFTSLDIHSAALTFLPAISPKPMDFESLKEQWGEVEDRDGVRLSWNVFPSSRMVCCSRYLHGIF